MRAFRNRILIVDDDDDILRGAQLRLGGAGYKMFLAHDGAEGIVSAVENNPHAIVMDVRMPRMDGLTALSRLRERRETKDIPVVMLSASLVDQQAALNAGARYFIPKPYQGQTLLAAVDSALSDRLQPA
jgi:DNA-binding response OmpR family regulator